MMNKVAGVIVLYNPNEDEVIKNISSYLDELDVLYCIDNTNKANNFFESFKKCIYIPNFKNLGLAKALSEGCDRAIKDGASIIATFDQDTIFEPKCISTMVNYINSHKEVGVVSPNIKRIIRENKKRRVINKPWFETNNQEAGYVITSGCVFKASTYKATNGFDIKLFIGQIDQDFCCAVRQINKKVVRIGSIFMYQEMGNGKKHNFFGKEVYAPNLSAFRYYYIFRNERYLRKKWGKKYNICKVKLYKYILVVTLFENQKLKKLSAMFKGYETGKNLR